MKQGETLLIFFMRLLNLDEISLKSGDLVVKKLIYKYIFYIGLVLTILLGKKKDFRNKNVNKTFI